MLAIIVVIAGVMLAPAADIFVAPNGNDAWSGAKPSPTTEGNDGPLATLDAARQHAAALFREGKQVTVWIRGGTYRLERPVVFGPGDSGSADRPIIYAAYKDERPVFSGGRVVQGWTVGRDGWWRAPVAPDWTFSQLWVNGERRYRPRLPTKGYYHIAEKLAPTPAAAGKGNDRFQFEPGSINPDWYRRDDVEVLVFHYWIISRNRIKDVDATGNVVTFRAPTGYGASWADFLKGNRYLIENVQEALGKPGDWYLDRGANQLVYVPMPGERPDKTEVVAPVADTLLILQGDPASKRWVQHLVFRRLDFRHTAWNLPPDGRTFPQAEADLSGAIRMAGARDIAIEECSVAQTGTYAVDVAGACKRITIARCGFSDLGAGGVKMGETTIPADIDPLKNDLLTSHVTVEDCTIQNGGRHHPAAVGVWIGQNPYITVRNNDIHDFYYTGVSVGWSWGYQPAATSHNIIESNHIYDIGHGVLSDMGGIYTLGLQPDTVLRGNVIHDIKSFAYGGWGIYTDEGSTGILIENNIVYRTKSAGFHQHYGKENLIRNNVFAFGEEAQLMRSRVEEHLSFTMERNIVLFGDKPLLGGNWADENCRLDHNLYWRVDGKPFDFAGMTLEEWQAKGKDLYSVVADPKFHDPAKGDFRLRPGSPAIALGFQPIDASKAGPRVKFRRPLPTAGPAFPDPFAE
jgi:parallel beta-helix repeat protein